jgi:hypothetical protein
MTRPGPQDRGWVIVDKHRAALLLRLLRLLRLLLLLF